MSHQLMVSKTKLETSTYLAATFLLQLGSAVEEREGLHVAVSDLMAVLLR